MIYNGYKIPCANQIIKVQALVDQKLIQQSRIKAELIRHHQNIQEETGTYKTPPLQKCSESSLHPEGQ